MTWIALLLVRLLSLYQLCVLVYVLLSWLNMPMNGLVRLIHRLVEPALIPVRRLLYSRLPRQWMVLDWSPAALWLLISIAQSLIRGLFL